MEDKKVMGYIKTFLTGGVYLVAYLLGGWDKALEYVLIAAALDYIFGVLYAVSAKQFDYDIGIKGIAKKLGIFGAIMVAHLIDNVLGQTNAIRALVCYAFTVNEAFSVLKNLKLLGVPIPDFYYKKVEDLTKTENVQSSELVNDVSQLKNGSGSNEG